MRRSICFCEPHTALAGATGTWKFIYQTATPLKAGARLKFDLKSPGRPELDWETPSADLKAARNVIYGHLENGKPIACTEVDTPDSIIPQYEFVLPAAMKAGDSFTIVMGAPPKKTQTEERGSRAQTMIQRRRQFLLYVDPKGNGSFAEAEIFSLDVRGNALHAIRVLAPSLVGRNKRFDITVRFEDEFGNLTSSAPENTLIDLSYENLRENLNWKLFIPETGFVTLPNLYFNEVGTYRIRLENLATKEVFISSPMKCVNETPYQLFWGLLHGESERVDSTENVEACLRHFRDERNLNFFGSSSFDSYEETSNEIWKLISQNIASFNEEDRFATFLGFQWRGESPIEGTRIMLYAKDNKPLLHRKELKNNSLKKIYRSLVAGELLAIPTFTGAKGLGFDFEDFHPDFERVVEIYNAWGSSECSSDEGNPLPIKGAGKKGVGEFKEGMVQRALKRNRRVGFVAGGLDDRGIYSGFFEGDQQQYTAGLTAILSAKHNREALLAALFNRSCYATTGERIIVGLFLAGSPMGSELSTGSKPGLRMNRHLSGYIAGTAPLQSVEIIRNGEVMVSLPVDGDELEFTYDDLESLEKVAMSAESGPAFAYYYLRVTQEDQHMAWSSPIWVDCVEEEASKRLARKAAPKRTTL
jgi:hypothetical protein